MLQPPSRDPRGVILAMRHAVPCSALPRAIFYGVIYRMIFSQRMYGRAPARPENISPGNIPPKISRYPICPDS